MRRAYSPSLAPGLTSWWRPTWVIRVCFLQEEYLVAEMVALDGLCVETKRIAIQGDPHRLH